MMRRIDSKSLTSYICRCSQLTSRVQQRGVQIPLKWCDVDDSFLTNRYGNATEDVENCNLFFPANTRENSLNTKDVIHSSERRCNQIA